MKTHIRLTEEKLGSLKYDDVLAITIAESGAMGVPNLLEVVDKDLNLYGTILEIGKVDFKKFEDKLTLLKTLRVHPFGEISNLEDGWEHFYMGAGNNLFLRNKYANSVEKYIDDNYADEKFEDGKEKPKALKRYIHWFEALKNIVTSEK